jgi:hypothetical protein
MPLFSSSAAGRTPRGLQDPFNIPEPICDAKETHTSAAACDPPERGVGSRGRSVLSVTARVTSPVLHPFALQEDLDNIVARLDALIRGDAAPLQSSEFREWRVKRWKRS